MDQPKISIIIPVFDVEPWLSECLDSVVCQSYEHLEIILVDDGSSDGSDSICDTYQRNDSRIRVIHQEHAGLSAARNRGLEEAAGSIIVFLDSDDVMKPDAIERIRNKMVQTKADMLVFGVESYDGSGIVSSPSEGWYDKKETLRSYVTKDGIVGAIWTKAFKASLLSDIRFREGHNYADGAVFLKLLEKTTRLYAIPDQLVRYRTRAGSITASNNPDDLMDRLMQTKCMREYAESVNDGTIDDVVEKLKTAQITNMLESYSRLFDDRSDKSEKLKAAYRAELMKTEKTGVWVVDSATKVFRFSPTLFVRIRRFCHRTQMNYR